MGALLRVVHNNCGDKPQVGKTLQMRGTDTVAVFFTVVNHPQGNKQVAGLLIASASGPDGIEAALVSDDASRFGSTVNPMLSKLFSVWHPDGVAATTSASNGKSAAPAAAGGHSAPAATRASSRPPTARRASASPMDGRWTPVAPAEPCWLQGRRANRSASV